MRILKALGVFLVVAVAIALILMLVLPTRQRVERSIIINSPTPIVYEYLSKLANFSRWSVWSKNDSSLRYVVSGTDGTPGAINTWKGDPATSGEGKIEIVSLDINKEIGHFITFERPKLEYAKCKFKLEDLKGRTRVTWQFDLITPRPGNVTNVFSSIEKRMGKAFEEGLKNLKPIIEKNNARAKVRSYDVFPFNFPSTSFAFYRQDGVDITGIQSFYDQYLPRLHELVVSSNATPASPSGLFFNRDENNQRSDVAAAIPVPHGTSLGNDSFPTLDISASKAIYVNYYGSDANKAEAYASMLKYIETHKYREKSPVIEQYITDRNTQKDTSRWLTKIIFLLE